MPCLSLGAPEAIVFVLLPEREPEQERAELVDQFLELFVSSLWDGGMEAAYRRWGGLGVLGLGLVSLALLVAVFWL